MKYNIYYILLLLIFMASCKEDIRRKAPDEGKKIKHWDYQGESGPEHWAEIDNNDCGGKFQSPIDIVDVRPESNLAPLPLCYNNKTKIHNVMNNGHSIQFNFNQGDYMILNGEKYELMQFHFHEPAEHTIKGVRFPLEIHLVHVNKNGKYAVLAIMAQENTANSESFDFLENYLPLSVNETKNIDKYFNMNDVLPEKKQYYAYLGSLTTPPCTEDVQWFVFKVPIDVSIKMIGELRGCMPVNNYRTIQPVNGRVTKESL